MANNYKLIHGLFHIGLVISRRPWYRPQLKDHPAVGFWLCALLMFYFIFILHSYRILSRSLAGHECSVNGSAMYMTETYLFTINNIEKKLKSMALWCMSYVNIWKPFNPSQITNRNRKVPGYSPRKPNLLQVHFGSGRRWDPLFGIHLVVSFINLWGYHPPSSQFY